MNIRLICEGNVTLFENLESVNIKEKSLELIFPDNLVFDVKSSSPILIQIEDEEIKTQKS